jgi:hypothetical protein
MRFKKSHLFFISVFFLLFIGNICTATVFFEFDGENGYQYTHHTAPHSGGGYFAFLGGYPFYPEGGGCDDGYEYHNTILSNEEAAANSIEGSKWSLKTPYSGGCPQESFKRDTTIIKLPDQRELYIRWYQKWTGDWNSADVQHKFTKFYNAGKSDSLAVHFSFAPRSRIWRNFMRNVDNHFAKGGGGTYEYVWVYAIPRESPSITTSYDDYNNGINGGDDGNFIFETDKWYCIETHFKLNSDENTSDGVVEAWIDGVKVFGVENYKFYGTAEDKFTVNNLEFQHIYYNRSSNDQPTYMDNIVIADEYIGPMIPKKTAPTPPQNLKAQ